MLSPVAASAKATPPPSSTPAPVSASPPSWRSPSSSEGLSVAPPSISNARPPSSTRRTRLASAVVSTEFAACSESMRTKNASALSAKSISPVASCSMSAPRAPTAPRRIDVAIIPNSE